MAWIQIQYRSSASRMPTAVEVVIPQNRPERLPVLYLLHDVGQSPSYWIRNTRIEALAEQYGAAVIMPQGFNTFYMDTKNQRAVQTFLSQELPELSAFWFGVEADPKRTAIAGRGMGGFGAAFAFLCHPDRFGVASVSEIKDPGGYYDDPGLAEQDGVDPRLIWGEKTQWEELHFWENFRKARQGGGLMQGPEEESLDEFLDRTLAVLCGAHHGEKGGCRV